MSVIKASSLDCQQDRFALYSPQRCATLKDVQRKKVDLKKVLSAMNTTCPSCGYSIVPSEIVRIDFERMICPKCGKDFDAGKIRKAKREGRAS
jgi:predicted RNA-binding Zn-ribbon protein involved in translation (DUF1610 family)